MGGENRMGHPIDLWQNQEGSFVMWSLFVAIHIWYAWRTGRLSTWALVLGAATLSAWQEYFADWGAYLAWNPEFIRMPWWGEMAYTTPVKPLCIPFAWGWFFGLAIPVLSLLVDWLCRRFPKPSRLLIAMLTAVPLMWAYDVSVESSAVAKGWWTYAHTIGPTLYHAKGNFPLIFPPILLGPWAAIMVTLLGRDANGVAWWERRLHLDALIPGWRREAARLGWFTLLFMVTFFVTNVLPQLVIRGAFGVPSTLVP